MTQSDPQAPRANHHGDPCPAWCEIDHNGLLIPGKPEFGPNFAHWSGITAHTEELMVRLSLYPGLDTEPRIYLTTLYGMQPVHFTPAEADNLATLLELAYGGRGNKLAGLLCAAAATAREAQ